MKMRIYSLGNYLYYSNQTMNSDHDRDVDYENEAMEDDDVLHHDEESHPASDEESGEDIMENMEQ